MKGRAFGATLFTLSFLALGTGQALAKQSHLVILVGLGGDDEHRERFHEWAARFREAVIERHGISAEQVSYLGEKPEMAPEIITGKSTKENILATFGELQKAVAPGDQVYVVLFGHGSFTGDEARFNLPGPDLTTADFEALLAPFGEQLVVFVNTASASGEFMSSLSADNRVIVTATKSGNERNETQFGKFFVDAYAGEEADTDKNERVSVLEAFDYARLSVDRYYAEENLLKTEHAQLDDNGDGVGIPAPSDEEGRFAGSTYFLATEPVEAYADPELRALVEKRQELEGRVEALRLQKSTMPEDLYNKELESLLLELARVSQQIEERSEE